MSNFPTRTIVLWHGAIVDIPAGWLLCNGANGTPDLRNRFLVGAGDTYSVDDTGGSINHTHNFTGAGHTHNIGAGGEIAAGANFDASTDQAFPVGTTDAKDGRPPYHALAYIMKT